MKLNTFSCNEQYQQPVFKKFEQNQKVQIGITKNLLINSWNLSKILFSSIIITYSVSKLFCINLTIINEKQFGIKIIIFLLHKIRNF